MSKGVAQNKVQVAGTDPSKQLRACRAGRLTGIRDFDPVTGHPARAAQIREEAAVATTQVEHAGGRIDPLRDRRVVGARHAVGGRRSRRTPRFRRGGLDRGRDPLEIRADDRVILRVVEQERVVAVRRDDLGVRNAALIVHERLDDLARACGGKAPVGREGGD